ncbi:MAG: ribosome small subunit-dependent GTPase A, partial [Cellulomonadaceae bacterium]|nr:ribosome small subunit-dependent GTPase A [Cellulomonadaceae bacterium]
STPAAGDWVVAEPLAGASRRTAWSVVEVLPRRTAVERAQVAAGSSYRQVLAANVDVVAVVEAMTPDPTPGRIERLLALAWASGARPVVVLTKADLHPDPDGLVAQVVGLAAGCDVLAVATTLGAGLEPLRDALRGGATIALIGASGVGKSTLLNALVGTPGGADQDHETMRTQSLGAENKGRHTTVTRELHLGAEGGAVLDTPGMRAVGLSGDEQVEELFGDIDELAALCRFSDCGHAVEPGCAVRAAIEDGTLPARRLESYRALEREAAHQAARADVRLRAQRASEMKARTRAYRARPQKKL